MATFFVSDDDDVQLGDKRISEKMEEKKSLNIRQTIDIK
jgi:hypothetical protein